MNALLSEMKRSLAELELGLKGDLTISETMERLMHALANDAVPGKADDTPRSNAPRYTIVVQEVGEIWRIRRSGHWDRG